MTAKSRRGDVESERMNDSESVRRDVASQRDVESERRTVREDE
jgi:hypothetical protein